MLYCTYDEYRAAGGSTDEQAFDRLCRHASRLIDRETFGQAAAHAAQCVDCRAALSDACGRIVDLLAAGDAAGILPGAQSVSNDGYSVSFAAGSNATTALAAEAAETLRQALGADPHGLLYRGCC